LPSEILPMEVPGTALQRGGYWRANEDPQEFCSDDAAAPPQEPYPAGKLRRA
jgi:hypothetical protein